MNLKKIKKYLIFALTCIVILGFGYFLRYPKYYIGRIYDYKIKLAEQSGNYTKAEKFYKKKISLADTYFSKSSAFDDLIRFYVSQRLYENAIELYLKEKLQTPAQLISPVNSCKNFVAELNLAEIYCEIAFLYLEIGDFEKTKEYVNKAADTLKTLDKNYNYETGKRLIKINKILAYVEIKKGNFYNSKKYIDETENIPALYNLIQKEGQSAYADYYEALFYYYINKKEYDNAKLCIEKLFSLASAVFLPLDLVSELESQGNYLIYLNKNTGELYYRTKEYMDAVRHLKISYNLSYELNGKYHPDTICAKHSLAKIYKKQNRQEIAKRYVDEIKNEVKGFKLLKNINGNNVEKKLDNFCS